MDEYLYDPSKISVGYCPVCGESISQSNTWNRHNEEQYECPNCGILLDSDDLV